jgi:hypothetical protein
MPHYETIFEDGSYSIASYKNDEEALQAITAHHERATKGEPALLSDPEGRVKATRIVKVLKYDEPPGDLLEAQVLPEDQVKKELETAISDSTKDGVTDLRELAARIRDLSNPLVVSEPHESNYKAKETEELSLPWLS